MKLFVRGPILKASSGPLSYCSFNKAEMRATGTKWDTLHKTSNIIVEVTQIMHLVISDITSLLKLANEWITGYPLPTLNIKQKNEDSLAKHGVQLTTLLYHLPSQIFFHSGPM